MLIYLHFFFNKEYNMMIITKFPFIKKNNSWNKLCNQLVVSLLVPDFTIFVYGSSCNSSFSVTFSLLFFLYLQYFLAFHPAPGMPINRKRKQRSKRETAKKENDMNCRKQKLQNPGP